MVMVKDHCFSDTAKAQGNAVADAAAKAACSLLSVTTSDTVMSETQQIWSSLLDITLIGFLLCVSCKMLW